MSVTYASGAGKGRGAPANLSEIFQDYLHRYVDKLRIRWPRASGLCPFHHEKTPSLSIDLEKCVFHCFGCGAEGGVKRFAALVGEPWGSTRSESRTAKNTTCTLPSRAASPGDSRPAREGTRQDALR